MDARARNSTDSAAATKAGIIVTRVPDYCLDEVSDHTMALLLTVARKITLATAGDETRGGGARG